MSDSDIHISDFKFTLNHFYHIWEARCELWLEGNGSSEGGMNKLENSKSYWRLTRRGHEVRIHQRLMERDCQWHLSPAPY